MGKAKWLSVAVSVAVLVAGLAPLRLAAGDEGKSGDAKGPKPEKIVFIHFRGGNAKPPWAGGGGGGAKAKDREYYTYLAKGARWTSPEVFVLDPENSHGIPAEGVLQAVNAGMEAWEDCVEPEIFGTLRYAEDGETVQISYDEPDEKNCILFGDYPQPGVIAVAIVWGYFSGPPDQRQIIEADILFDNDFAWGDADPDGDGTPDVRTVMDLQNIASHEIGHAAGMGDLYQDAASEQTMYGYSSYGEVKKRTLEPDGDIPGIQNLYK